jgi:ATP-dependent DNA ligase
MLVSPASELPTGQEWAFEVKWDGMRAMVSVGPDDVSNPAPIEAPRFEPVRV